MRDATISIAIKPSLLIKHDFIVICRWVVEAKRKASPNTRWRDPPNASSRLTNFTLRGEKAGHFREVAGVFIVDAGGSRSLL